MLYAGQYQDSETGFYYLRNRYYDPATAQFLTIDPDVSQTQAPYTYTSDNPLNATDPLGLCWPHWACGAEHWVGHIVSTHKVAIGIGLGLLSIATGFGALVIAAEAADGISLLATGAGLVSLASGGTAAGLDLPACVNDPGINGQCLGLTLGGIGVLMSAPEILVSAGVINEPAYQGMLVLATGGLFAGMGAVLSDDLQALYDNLTRQLGPSQKGICE